MDITRITPGAERPEQYLHLLKGKKTAFIGNQTSSVNGRHTLDFLIENGVEVIKIFGPEHGFRDMADDATPVVDKTDVQTGLPKRNPSSEALTVTPPASIFPCDKL